MSETNNNASGNDLESSGPSANSQWILSRAISDSSSATPKPPKTSLRLKTTKGAVLFIAGLILLSGIVVASFHLAGRRPAAPALTAQKPSAAVQPSNQSQHFYQTITLPPSTGSASSSFASLPKLVQELFPPDFTIASASVSRVDYQDGKSGYRISNTMAGSLESVYDAFGKSIRQFRKDWTPGVGARTDNDAYREAKNQHWLAKLTFTIKDSQNILVQVDIVEQ